MDTIRSASPELVFALRRVTEGAACAAFNWIRRCDADDGDRALATGKKLTPLAEILGKDVSELTVFVLEKPRHRELVSNILAAGARVALYPAGDVAGALMAAIPGSGIDALMGTGGTPEGVMSACAIRAIGGEFLARLDPQLQTEAKAVKDAGIDTAKWYDRDEIITWRRVFLH